jgi:hypothetical protein
LSGTCSLRSRLFLEGYSRMGRSILRCFGSGDIWNYAIGWIGLALHFEP